MPVPFIQSGCAGSRKVRDWLAERGVAFTECNVTGDKDTARALVATGTFATPCSSPATGSSSVSALPSWRPRSRSRDSSDTLSRGPFQG